MEQEDSPRQTVRFKVVHFLNIFLGKKIKPKLVTRGQSMNKRQLQVLLARDQECFNQFIDEYNNDVNTAYVLMLTHQLRNSKMHLTMRKFLCQIGKRQMKHSRIYQENRNTTKMDGGSWASMVLLTILLRRTMKVWFPVWSTCITLYVRIMIFWALVFHI